MRHMPIAKVIADGLRHAVRPCSIGVPCVKSEIPTGAMVANGIGNQCEVESDTLDSPPVGNGGAAD